MQYLLLSVIGLTFDIKKELREIWGPCGWADVRGPWPPQASPGQTAGQLTSSFILLVINSRQVTGVASGTVLGLVGGGQSLSTGAGGRAPGWSFRSTCPCVASSRPTVTDGSPEWNLLLLYNPNPVWL